MIEHLALLKLRSDIPPEKEEKMLTELKNLKITVPFINNLSCGRNLSDRSQGFTHGLLVQFKTKSDLENYLSHPEHERVVRESLRPVVEDVIVVDYEA